MNDKVSDNSSSSYREFLNKLKDDDSLTYLLDEYPEIIQSLSVNGSQFFIYRIAYGVAFNRRDVQNLDCSRKGCIQYVSIMSFRVISLAIILSLLRLIL